MRYNVYSKRVSVLFPRLYRPDDCATGQQRAQSMCLLSELRRRRCVPWTRGRRRACIGVLCHPSHSFDRSFSFVRLPVAPPNEFLQYL